MEHGRDLYPPDGRHRRVVQVGVEGDHVGIGRHDRLDQLVRDRAVGLDPPLRFGDSGPLRGQAQPAIEPGRTRRAARAWRRSDAPARL